MTFEETWDQLIKTSKERHGEFRGQAIFTPSDARLARLFYEAGSRWILDGLLDFARERVALSAKKAYNPPSQNLGEKRDEYTSEAERGTFEAPDEAGKVDEGSDFC